MVAKEICHGRNQPVGLGVTFPGVSLKLIHWNRLIQALQVPVACLLAHSFDRAEGSHRDPRKHTDLSASSKREDTTRPYTPPQAYSLHLFLSTKKESNVEAYLVLESISLIPTLRDPPYLTLKPR